MNKIRIRRAREDAIVGLRLELRRFVAKLASNFAAAESVGLNSTDLGSLCLLLLHGPTRAGRLAQLTGLTSGAVTGVIDRLETSGYVRREPDPGDRRRVIVVPDASRVERVLFPHFSSIRPAATTEFFERYTMVELAAIADFLARLGAAE